MDSQETSLYTAILITAVTLSVIIGYFFVSIIRQQRRNLLLQKENMRIEINAMEAERARIANDLHDDISPVLSVIRFQINNIHTQGNEDDQQVQEASAHLDNLVGRLREISNNLMPASLLRKGLIVSLSEFLRQVEASANLKVAFTYEENLILSQEKSINLYRMVQELVHNSIKHAAATELGIELKTQAKNLLLLYSDNGVGFDYEEAIKKSSGFGLRSLRSRVDLMGGSIRQDGKLQKGTQLLVQVPLN
jgi:signal transduction histidine kinase